MSDLPVTDLFRALDLTGVFANAMLGGVILGVAETLAAAYISSEYKDIVAFGLLVLI